MKTQEYTEEFVQQPECLALTVRKEHRLMVIKKVSKTTFRMSWKTLLYMVFLMFANALV